MNNTPVREFLKRMETMRYIGNLNGLNTDILQIIYSLRVEVKDFFPMNQVPVDIVDNLSLTQNAFKKAQESLDNTLDLLIEEIKKIDNLNEEEK